MSEEQSVTVQVENIADMKFRVGFGLEGVNELTMDEPPPLGEGSGPNAVRLLGAAIGNCLGASLLFCLRKAKVDVQNLSSQVSVGIQRGERGRLRVASASVDIVLDVEDEAQSGLQRCSQLFEDFCVVTASIRPAIPVSVTVTANGQQVYRNG